MNTLAIQRTKSDDYVSLLKMIIQMKSKEVVEAKIFTKGDAITFKWLQSMQFKSKMILEVEEGPKETEDKLKKEQDRDYELLKGPHVDS